MKHSAFRQPGNAGALEGSRLTIHGAQGRDVTFSLRPSGELEARFSRGAGAGPGAALVLVNPAGREVAHLGEPVARQLAP
jgi:hypothetical protein